MGMAATAARNHFQKGKRQLTKVTVNCANASIRTINQTPTVPAAVQMRSTWVTVSATTAITTVLAITIKATAATNQLKAARSKKTTAKSANAKIPSTVDQHGLIPIHRDDFIFFPLDIDTGVRGIALVGVVVFLFFFQVDCV